MQAFTDLVGTAVVPARCFDSTELTDLTPALDTAAAIHGMAAVQTPWTGGSGHPSCLSF